MAKVKKSKKRAAFAETTRPKATKLKKVTNVAVRIEAADDPNGKKRKKLTNTAVAVTTEPAIDAMARKQKKASKKGTNIANAEEAINAEEPMAEIGNTSSKPKKQERFSCFVGGIQFSIEKEQVRKDFAECGEILDFRFPLTDEGNPKGYCFIDYVTRAGLDAAIAYDGEDYWGRTLQVKEANSSGGKRSNWKVKTEGGKIDPGTKPPSCKSVILKNLAYGMSEQELRRHFKPAGNIVNVTLLKDRNTGEPNGIAFVDFESTEQVDKAIELNDSMLRGRKMHVNYSQTKRQ